MTDSVTVSPGTAPRSVRTPEGKQVAVPAGWDLLPPGDAGLTRRVKALGPTWVMVEMKGRKKFSKGLWAPAENIVKASSGLEVERATPAYQKKLDAGRARRDREQQEYVGEFEREVATFLRFSPPWAQEQSVLALAVTTHATPVGSGTVARTERIPVERRAEAAVIAWMRHQTTAYDNMSIARVKGARREVRRELAEVSRAVLDLHRKPIRHTSTACPLCTALTPLLVAVARASSSAPNVSTPAIGATVQPPQPASPTRAP